MIEIGNVHSKKKTYIFKRYLNCFIELSEILSKFRQSTPSRVRKHAYTKKTENLKVGIFKLKVE